MFVAAFEGEVGVCFSRFVRERKGEKGVSGTAALRAGWVGVARLRRGCCIVTHSLGSQFWLGSWRGVAGWLAGWLVASWQWSPFHIFRFSTLLI